MRDLLSNPNPKELLSRYLDATQHVWNTYFWGEVVDLKECEPLESYQKIDEALFYSLVLFPLGIPAFARYEFKTSAVPELIVRPSNNSIKLELSFCDLTDGRRVWGKNEPIDVQGLELQLIEFFQFDRYGCLDMNKLRCRITKSGSDPALVGRIVLAPYDLIDVIHVPKSPSLTELSHRHKEDKL